MSTLGEWNKLFDEEMKPVILPDGRGKATKVTAETVRRIVKAAEDLKASGRRLRIKSFRRWLASEEKIVLSSKTISDILIANDLYKVRIKRRRPRFYQSLRQSIANGVVSVDGSEFTVRIDQAPYKFNVELSVDVESYCHSAFSVSDGETTSEFIKVMEAHKAAWGPPLALVVDHGSANLSAEARAYLEGNDIEIVAVGPRNPKGNGSVEGAFSEMKRVIGSIDVETSSPEALAKGVLEKVVSVYITMRNRLARCGETHPPEKLIQGPTSEQQREHYRQRYNRHKHKGDDPSCEAKLERLDWLIRHHSLEVDERAFKRAQKCIVGYELEAIGESEQAFLKAIRRDQRRRNLAYFFGILKRVQDEQDAKKYRDYCSERYNYQQMIETQRQREQTDDVTKVEDLVAMLQQAVLLHIEPIKAVTIRQAKRMAHNLKSQYRYVGALKRKISDALAAITELSLSQRQQAWELVEQFLS
jgi:transposase InsO family protein